MLSHVSWFERQRKLTIDQLEMQVTMRFWMAGSVLRGDVDAGLLEFDSHIDVVSTDPPDKIAALLDAAERTCFVLRALVTEVTVNRSFALNGEPLTLDGTS